MGRVIAEIISIPRLLSTERTSGSDAETFRYIEADHDPLFLELAQTGRGSVVLGAHIGCFELLAAYYVRRGVRLSAIGRLPNYSSVTKLLRAVRSSYGVETIWREESGPKVLIKAIRSNRCIAPLIDQDINLTNVFNPFFGLDSAHPSGPIRLAVKNNLPVFCAWILRLPSNKHKTVVKQIHYDPKSPNAEAEILSEYCARIEQVISQHPEQWLWWHRRWRRRPGVDYTADPDLLPGTKGYVAWLRGTTKNLQESRE